MKIDKMVINSDNLDVKYNCYICGCDAGQVNLSNTPRIIPTPCLLDVLDVDKERYNSYKLCSTCTKKMVEYMELLKNTSAQADKPKPCVVCGSENTEVVHDVDRDDNERWYAHCNDCGTSYSNEKVEWSEKETLKWWNELKR